MTDKGRRSLGRQAQMMPLLASMTDQTVAGMGPPGVVLLRCGGENGKGEAWLDLHVGSRSLAERTRVVVRTIVVKQTLGGGSLTV